MRPSGVTFVGRLATYRYYNMDQIVGQALATFRRMDEMRESDGLNRSRSKPPEDLRRQCRHRAVHCAMSHLFEPAAATVPAP